MNKLYFIGGSKGGVGKSFVSIALTDYLTQKQNKKIKLIESDTSNPDVGKTFINDEKVEVVSCRLDDADGWIELVNICEGSGMDVVVNSAARSNEAVSEFGTTLIGSLEELQMELITFWIINRQRDSIELLKKYMESVPSPLHVVRNTFYGDPKKFELYNTSKTKTEVEARGGKSLDFPDLADRVADDIYSKRLTIEHALEDMPLGNRAELKRWRGLSWSMFDSIIETQAPSEKKGKKPKKSAATKEEKDQKDHE